MHCDIEDRTILVFSLTAMLVSDSYIDAFQSWIFRRLDINRCSPDRDGTQSFSTAKSTTLRISVLNWALVVSGRATPIRKSCLRLSSSGDWKKPSPGLLECLLLGS